MVLQEVPVVDRVATETGWLQNCSNLGYCDFPTEIINGLISNVTLLSILLTSLGKDKNPLNCKSTFKAEYDYIIVGCGSAGSVMASRLSEKPCVTVLCLEAGGEAPWLTEVPGYARIFFGSCIDWKYKTQRQKYAAFGQKENKVICNNGKVVGGSSVMNAMLNVWGNKKNYDEWEAEGAEGWSYEDVLPYFKKIEDNRNIQEMDPGYHEKGGPVTVEKINYCPEIEKPILKATKDMRYEQVDVNGRRQTGIPITQATVRNQQRCSAAKAYLEPARDRENLDILTQAFVLRILIDKSSAPRAYGVEFEHKGRTHTVRARKEVIISNGALRTPQILMLSGIGPKEELQKHNISIVSDVPVGKNLQDHCASHLIYTVNRTIEPLLLKLLNPLNMMDYATHRKGPLCAPTQVSLMAFLDGMNTTANSTDFPRQQLYWAEYFALDAKCTMNVKDEVYNKVYAPYEKQALFICFSSLLQPYSRGEITLNSTNPHDYPCIDPRYYEDERDLKDVVEGLKICNAVAKHPEMQKVQAKLIKEQSTCYPGCEEYKGDEDAHLTCIAKQLVNTFWHYCGTARMGAIDDPRSVVDPQLRVIGVKDLRVVSAAVMPIIPSANTNVPTMMVAEKAYDMMKDDVKCAGPIQITAGPIQPTAGPIQPTAGPIQI